MKKEAKEHLLKMECGYWLPSPWQVQNSGFVYIFCGISFHCLLCNRL